MAATRFYLATGGGGTAPAVTPPFNAGWEQVGQVSTLALVNKAKVDALVAIGNTSARTVPITTTQDIICNQYVSEPIPAQNIGTDTLFSLVVGVFEDVATTNCTLAVVAYVVSQDGQTVRGTLYSNFNVDTEFATTRATRIVAQTAVTAVTTQPGDRIVVEIGAHAAAPSAGGSYTMRLGFNAASDFALTTALSTDLNPWCEFSKDLFNVDNNNYRSFKVGSTTSPNTGIISVGERIR